MIQSNSTYIEPIKGGKMSGGFKEKCMNSFYGTPSNPDARKKIKRITIRIGNDVFRTMSGSRVGEQSKLYKDRLRKIGVLLSGERSLEGFCQFLRGK